MTRKRTILPIDDLQAAAASIRAERNCDVIREQFLWLLKYYDVVNYSLGYGWPLWRVRKCGDATGFPNIADVYYPPNPSAGRVNEPRSPMLYLSFNKFTAFHEVHANEGDFLHLIGYKIAAERMIRCCTVGEINNVHKSGRAITSEELGKALNKILNKLSHEVGISFVFMDAFLSAVLADTDSASRDHIHSRTLASVLFDRNPDVEAIHYPSVALEGSMNLAIKPTIADQALTIACTSVLRINKKYDYGITTLVW